MRISGGVIGLAGALSATAGLLVVALAVDEGRGRGARDRGAAERLHEAAATDPQRHRAGPGTTTSIASQEKVSFCLRDSRQVPGGLGPTREHYGDCGRNKVQGISPGWADVYRAELPGQMLELPDELADGPYCLHALADPLDLLQETDEGDNAAVRSFHITGNDVRPGDRAVCAVQ